MSLIQAWDINGKKVDLTRYGLYGLKLHIPSPSYTVERESFPGRPGSVNTGKDLDSRLLTAEFRVEAHDYIDSILLRDELHQLFSDKFYIGESKHPGKRWFVECVDQWNPERINRKVSRIEISLFAEKGMAESVGTTLTAFEWDADAWQWGMGIPFDDGYKYIHTTNTFNIYNAGNEKIDPRYMALLIEIKGTTSSFVELINRTTGETFRYDGTMTASDTLRL